MFNINRRALLRSSAVSFALSSLPKLVDAQASSYSPADLNGVLTPFGALRAGNESGTITAWTGGYAVVPDGYQQGDPRPIPPILLDKQLFTINAANMAQYESKLSIGTQAMFQKFSDYRLEVFPTHRTAVAPQYVYDYQYKNATNATLSDNGNAVAGAYGGIPFPIPTNGHHVIWNHLLAYSGTTVYQVSDAHTITASGQIILQARTRAWGQSPFYIEGGEGRFNGIYKEFLVDPIAPPYEAGGLILLRNPVNPDLIPVQGYLYLVGQRRIRSAPELEFDTPNSLTGGIVNWDEGNVFFGKLDEYDFNYLGVKEMYVPYNTNKAWNAPIDQQFLAHFVNPELTRWELHRVRVVEMLLKPGYRNVDARRLIYTDEDTGAALLGEVYDSTNKLWKFQHLMPAILPDVPCVNAGVFYVTYDLHSGDYSASNHASAATSPAYKIIPELPETFFSAQELSAKAGGF